MVPEGAPCAVGAQVVVMLLGASLSHPACGWSHKEGCAIQLETRHMVA